MRWYPAISVFCALITICAHLGIAQDVKVVLSGNTALLTNTQQLFRDMDNYLSAEKGPVLWVLNGDIFPPAYSGEMIALWQSSVFELLNRFPNLQVLINQGDLDWNNSGKDGWKRIQALDKILTSRKHDRFHVFLEQGCPGPWTMSFSPQLEVVVINSQWWNHPYEKPTPLSAVCPLADTDIFIEELEGILDNTDNQNVLLLSHFPLISVGSYGGRFPVSAYLFPPVLGSARVGFHQNVGTSRDLNNANFSALRYKLDNVLRNYSSLILASGHEENQFVIKAGDNYQINSGALASGRYVARTKSTLMRSASPGVIELTYHVSGEVSYQFIALENGQYAMEQKGVLFYSSCSPAAKVPINTVYKPCRGTAAAASKTDSGDKTTTTQAIAGSEYASSDFKQHWLGRHYRVSWTTPVNVPFLDMDTTHRGLQVEGKGGGRQTTSLKLSGKDGKEYVFRSVNKDPSKALPLELRGTLISEVLKDQTSTQQPYAAMAVSYWLDKLGILHASPSLYVLPDNDALGSFRTQYAHLFGMLEERPTDKIDAGNVFAGAKDIEKSFKMFEKIYRDHDNRINTVEFVRARMFDIWIGDWSKHEDNWKWAGYKTDKGELFRPIPRDRDHAFSRWDGIIPWLGDREWAMPNGENFDVRIKGLRSLMWQARHLDRFAARDVTREEWIKAATFVQSSITEKDIEEGVRRMPSEIYEPDGKEIEAKLKMRIKDLPYYAGAYYDMLAQEVDVTGSNKREYFLVVRNANGTVTVTVTDLNKDQTPDTSIVYYRRTFYPRETKEIRLFGLQGDDVFEIEGKTDQSILVRVIGDYGDDRISDRSAVEKGSAKTLVYDTPSNTNAALGTEGRMVVPKDESFYHYDRSAFKYNTYLPIALVGYNPFTGVSLTGGVTFTRQRFGKPDYSTRHRVKGSVTAQGNFEVAYANQLRYLVGKWDGVSQFIVSRPLDYNYFFGVGNNTQKDNGESSNYYRTQYDMMSVTAGLTRTVWTRSVLALTASYELAEGIKRENSYLGDHPDVLGAEKVSLYFLNALVDLDFRDRSALPEHGFRLLFNQSAGHVSSVKGDIASISELEMENYFSTYNRNPFTVGLKVGGGTTGGQIPFYKLFSLGQMENLHGYKRNRFTGESKAYLNSELRWQIVQTHTLIPLKIGVRGFYDIGRVWADSDAEGDDLWHYGYGGGFYVTPFREQFSFNISAGSSKEESLILAISIGSFFR
ncbi:MAG TPA: BamA/TamA family outer membrane protein [Chryseolinea sp.]|nr:BamA/TamA family outer membrane protein [Chryseolinea sp.]